MPKCRKNSGCIGVCVGTSLRVFSCPQEARAQEGLRLSTRRCFLWPHHTRELRPRHTGRRPAEVLRRRAGHDAGGARGVPHRLGALIRLTAMAKPRGGSRPLRHVAGMAPRVIYGRNTCNAGNETVHSKTCFADSWKGSFRCVASLGGVQAEVQLRDRQRTPARSSGRPRAFIGQPAPRSKKPKATLAPKGPGAMKPAKSRSRRHPKPAPPQASLF